MHIRRLNFSKASTFNLPEVLLFFRPLGSSLHRCNRVPADLPEEIRDGIKYVLNELCVKSVGSTWYFKLGDTDQQAEFARIFYDLGVPALPVSAETNQDLTVVN